MTHMNDGSISAGDNDHPDFILYPSTVVEDGALYQFSQNTPQFHTGAGEIMYDPRPQGPDLDFSAMLTGEVEDLHSADSARDGKVMPTTFYSFSDPSSAYQPQPFYHPAPTAQEFSDFHSACNIPRTIGNIFNSPTAEDATLPTPIEENPRFLQQQPAFSLALQLGTHTEDSDYRSTSSASPTMSVGGFEGIEPDLTHSNETSAIGSLASAHSSVGGSPRSVHEDPWPRTMVEGMEMNAAYWDGGFINPKDLATNSPQATPIESNSLASSPYISPMSPRPASNRSSPRVSRRRTPSTHGRSHPTFPYPPPRRDSLQSNSSSGSRSPRLSPELKSSSPTGQRSSNGRDSVCPQCGKSFRDMKAHLLTHKLERPEKCPIATCDYYKKGFARKYDCQRHTLTHYKGTMVCGFCPLAGSPAEKSFNRADVFKRHLMTVHNVEQQPPNGRKKTSGNDQGNPQELISPSMLADPYSTHGSDGKCSTCGATFSTAQQLYDHLDDCVLSKVVQEDPAARFNELNLSQIKLEDIAGSLVSPLKGRRTKNKNEEGEEEEENDAEDEGAANGEERDEKEKKDDAWALPKDMDGTKQGKPGKTPSMKAKTTKIRGVRFRISKATARDGLRPRTRRGGKKRKNFPAAWGCPPQQMVTKRRCLMVYDGPSILLKDEMMMSTEWEVRTNMGGDALVSDLDFWTMQRAYAALDAAPVEFR